MECWEKLCYSTVNLVRLTQRGYLVSERGYVAIEQCEGEIY